MAEPSTGPRRIAALDFTKGVLVYIMVLYHWLNYFVGRDIDYRYLRFLTPSFIFITGFLISLTYRPRYLKGDFRPGKRLLQRGLKLLAIFVFLNILIGAMSPSRAWFAHDLTAVFLTGNVVPIEGGRTTSFNILVPIAYLLLLSAPLLRLSSVYARAFHVLAAALLAWLLVLHGYGAESAMLELVTIGVLGAVCGHLSLERVNVWVKRPAALMCAYAGYVIAISLWNVPFPLQVIGVCLSLLVIYSWGMRRGSPSRSYTHVVLAGRYSLLAYIGQVIILQLLRRGLWNMGPESGVLVVSFGTGVLLTAALVEAVHRARAKVRVVDRLYQVVFS